MERTTTYTDANEVSGNYIGTNEDESKSVGNKQSGVLVDAKAESNDVRGNIISGNIKYGVRITGPGTNSNVISENYIGTDRDADGAIPNTLDGVLIDGEAQSNRVENGNIISGNTKNGVRISGPGTNANIVDGNYVGTKKDDTQPLGNGEVGVVIDGGAQLNRIENENVISGNTWSGVKIEGSTTTGNFVTDNLIGTDKSGGVDVGNVTRGVLIDAAKSNHIEDNTISGNGEHGVQITDAAEANELLRNMIGTTKAGSVVLDGSENNKLANGQSGVVIDKNSTDNHIGTPGNGNTIAGNTHNGVYIKDANGNLVVDNVIGGAGRGNGEHGIRISNANENQIGAPATGGAAADGNTISHNGMDGVWVEAGAKNSIRLNSIFDNTGLGIDLGPDGVTQNDARSKDGDAGANNLQNFPLTLTIYEDCGGTKTVHGTIDSLASTTFQIDLYTVTSLDSTGFGEGKTHVATVPVTTDADGFGKFTHPSLTGADTVTATATDPNGKTSEFSTGYRLELEYRPTGSGTTGDLFADNPDADDLDGDGNPDTPAFGGGCRYFPDAASYATRTTSRNIVRVRASLTPATVDVPGYFRAFDVDDPSNDPDIDPGDPAPAGSGRDNRGTVTGATLDAPGPAGVGYEGRLRPVGGAFAAEGDIVSVNTSAAGIAEVELATSFAPGDNFRVAASVIEEVLAALDDANDVPTTGFVPGFGGAVTDQLAVWRRFHIEQDLMATTAGDQQAGAIAVAPVAMGGGVWRSTTTIAILRANEYEDGIRRTAGGVNYPVVGNSSGVAGGDWVETMGNPGIGGITLYQDDFVAPGGGVPVVREDTQSGAHLYDFLQESTVRADNRYADAYLQPELDTLDAFDSVTDGGYVTATTHASAATLAVIDTFRGTVPGGAPRPADYETDIFWVVYVTTGYEWEAANDNDDITEAGTQGITISDRVSITFVEAIHDIWNDRANYPNVASVDEFKARVTAHEVGHQFDVSVDSTPTAEHRPGTLMDSNAGIPLLGDFYLHPEDVAFLRERQHSPLQVQTEIEVDPNDVERLTPEKLKPIVDAAIQRWTAAGLDTAMVELLRQVDVRVANELPPSYVGRAFASIVEISADAAGIGWFVDSTPLDDVEYSALGVRTELTGNDLSPAKARVDLLTVVIHELGHVLGLKDLAPETHPHQIMTGVFAPGLRRLPSAATVSVVQPHISDESVPAGVVAPDGQDEPLLADALKRKSRFDSGLPSAGDLFSGGANSTNFMVGLLGRRLHEEGENSAPRRYDGYRRRSSLNELYRTSVETVFSYAGTTWPQRALSDDLSDTGGVPDDDTDLLLGDNAELIVDSDGTPLLRIESAPDAP